MIIWKYSIHSSVGNVINVVFISKIEVIFREMFSSLQSFKSYFHVSERVKSHTMLIYHMGNLMVT